MQAGDKSEERYEGGVGARAGGGLAHSKAPCTRCTALFPVLSIGYPHWSDGGDWIVHGPKYTKQSSGMGGGVALFRPGHCAGAVAPERGDAVR